jgi:nitrate/TMAO reductase-like tetraheme cytochrome c subunit
VSGGAFGVLKAALGAVPLRVWGLGLGLVAALGLVGLVTAVEVSSRPAFCGSCHIMKPYYESWQGSSHHNVACVECHIPPGVTAEIRKKYEALSMVARYFTGTYGTNPWTEIDDSACLRCHERRLLAGRELFGEIFFDHTPHLTQMRRGKKLRCTSCHSQIVQGSHIAVTAATCLLCHFKDQQGGQETARCTLCHPVPDKVIRQGGLTFNHSDVSRFGMDCTGCHSPPEEGTNGAVPRERCVTCHNEPDRLKEYENGDLLHRMHVTEHKVDCLNCHLEIQHVGPPRIEQAVTACHTCHEQGHSPQLNLYTGVGGRGVQPMPSAMFLAGIRCEGCHIEIPGQTGHVRKATDVACMSCHGPSYRKIYFDWKAETDRRTLALQRQVDETARAAGPAGQPALREAGHNLDLVARGRAVHNVAYAYALLEKSREELGAFRSSRGLSPLPGPWKGAPYSSPCLRCHQGVESVAGTIFGRHFSHEPHVARAGLECSLCHRTHEERERGEVVRFGESGCESCHHREPVGECFSCHGSVLERKVKSFRGEFDHAFHVRDAGQGCPDCHALAAGGPVSLKKENCATCHPE